MLDEDRNLAVNKWVRAIVLDPMSFTVARDYFRSKTMGFAKGELSSSVADALSVKATSTLRARVSHVLSGSRRGVQSIVYFYLEETQGKAAPTAFRSFLSSIAFCKFALGLLAADAVLSSVRVRGIAAKTYMDKRPLTQRDPLLVLEVEHLEKVLMDAGAVILDRIASGYFLFLVFGRARYSDGQRVTTLKLEQGGHFMEAEVKRSKSNMTLERKTPPVANCCPGRRDDWLPLG